MQPIGPVAIDPALAAAIDDIVAASHGPAALERIKAVLGEITRRWHARGVLVHEVQDDELLLHASPTLTIYHITLSPGLHYPPHNHLMDALIGLYRGGETNFVYAVADGKLDMPQRRDAIAPCVVQLAPQAVHSVANTGNARSGALHVYLGDLTRTQRQLWRLPAGPAEPFDNDRYLAGAVPIAPSASEPPPRRDDVGEAR